MTDQIVQVLQSIQLSIVDLTAAIEALASGNVTTHTKGSSRVETDNPELAYADFEADIITYGTDDNGKPVYKARGHPYINYGVRIWPEVFARLGVSIEEMVLGENKISPLMLRAVLNEVGNPRKIVGLSPSDLQPASNHSGENNSKAPPFPEPYPDREPPVPFPDDSEIPF